MEKIILFFQNYIFSKSQWLLLAEFFVFQVALMAFDVLSDILVGIQLISEFGYNGYIQSFFIFFMFLVFVCLPIYHLYT